MLESIDTVYPTKIECNDLILMNTLTTNFNYVKVTPEMLRGKKMFISVVPYQVSTKTVNPPPPPR